MLSLNNMPTFHLASHILIELYVLKMRYYDCFISQIIIAEKSIFFRLINLHVRIKPSFRLHLYKEFEKRKIFSSNISCIEDCTVRNSALRPQKLGKCRGRGVT